jgi:shikimate dehydrogenase
VVLTVELTPLPKIAAQRGCHYLIGTDMLFEQIPAYLEFFGYGTATPDELRATSRNSY